MNSRLAVTAIVFLFFQSGSSYAAALRLIDVNDTNLPRDKFGIVIVTHGWFEKGRGGWPNDMAAEIHKRIDPNLWICGYFDWSSGAKTLNPTDAAKHARDIAGPKLADEIISISKGWKHIHLIGHSSGCWAVSEAAKILAKKTKADIHLTFFDAYVPPQWKENSLGDVNAPAAVRYWADHYYTRDITLGPTQHNLTYAHNVDVTEAGGGLGDHNFPWRWYYASIAGKYPKGYLSLDSKFVCKTGGLQYGFARSREKSDPNTWEESIKLPVGNKAVILKCEQKIPNLMESEDMFFCN